MARPSSRGRRGFVIEIPPTQHDEEDLRAQDQARILRGIAFERREEEELRARRGKQEARAGRSSPPFSPPSPFSPAAQSELDDLVEASASAMAERDWSSAVKATEAALASPACGSFASPFTSPWSPTTAPGSPSPTRRLSFSSSLGEEGGQSFQCDAMVKAKKSSEYSAALCQVIPPAMLRLGTVYFDASSIQEYERNGGRMRMKVKRCDPVTGAPARAFLPIWIKTDRQDGPKLEQALRAVAKRGFAKRGADGEKEERPETPAEYKQRQQPQPEPEVEIVRGSKIANLSLFCLHLATISLAIFVGVLAMLTGMIGAEETDCLPMTGFRERRGVEYTDDELATIGEDWQSLTSCTFYFGLMLVIMGGGCVLCCLPPIVSRILCRLLSDHHLDIVANVGLCLAVSAAIPVLVFFIKAWKLYLALFDHCVHPDFPQTRSFTAVRMVGGISTLLCMISCLRFCECHHPRYCDWPPPNHNPARIVGGVAGPWTRKKPNERQQYACAFGFA